MLERPVVVPLGLGRSLRAVALLGATLPTLGCSDGTPAVGRPALAAERRSIGVSQAPLPEDGQWLMAAKDHQSSRFSGLDAIDASNVAGLRPAWTFSTGVRRGHEAAPLVVGGTMYLVSPFPNHLFALDLTRPGAPLKWKYTPPQQRAAQRPGPVSSASRSPTAARTGSSTSPSSPVWGDGRARS